MNILILGSGGREHAIAWKVSQSPLCTQLFVAPGNAGSAQCATNVNLDLNDFDALGQFVTSHHIHLVVVGPEEPLVKGITNYLATLAGNIAVVGPPAQGARLEGSKEFAKDFMTKYNIPTAAYQSFTAGTFNQAIDFLHTLKAPYVLKADGLAAGKGVVIATTLQEAVQALDNMLNQRAFGKASECVVIEEYLQGIELSVFVATDGTDYLLLPEAKDYKRIGEGDTGPNTGGMGAVSPVPFATEDFMQKVKSRIVEPTLEGLRKENIDYRGFIFVGLMNVDGEPYVIEYNVRLGDPETEAVIPRIDSDLVELFHAIATGQLSRHTLVINPAHALSVVLVSGGYPGSFEKGFPITGADQVTTSHVFYAGAALHNHQVVTTGGRVLVLTTVADNAAEARRITLHNARKIQFTHQYFRTDIGLDVQ
jgi:phosphoribosylamine---glycine ligase